MKLQRHLLLLATALLLTACSDEPTDTTRVGQAEVAFAVTADGVTRAATDFDTSLQFRVFAWKGSTLFIQQEPGQAESNVVSYNPQSGQWATLTTYYWPEPAEPIDFYAVYPKDAPFRTASKTLDYSATPLDGSLDLLSAQTRQSVPTYDAAHNSYAADIAFQHALSRISFGADISVANMTVTVSSLEIHNVCDRGVYTYPTASAGSAFGTWATTDGSQTSYALAMDAPVSLKASSDPQSPVSLGEPLLLIPQTLTPWATSATIADNDGGAKGAYLKIGCQIELLGDIVADGYVYCPVAGSWQPGTRYSYVLHFGAGYDQQGLPTLQPLTLTVSIAPWASVDIDASGTTLVTEP